MTNPPGSIQKLPKLVVDRIAAGEVVQRPSSVVKELLENSLDADSSCVSVCTEKGGLQKIVVSDNGGGIKKEDMLLVATRFATSKLRSTEDLESIESFGFRGEALASTSLVARLNVVSRTRSATIGHKMSYLNGEPIGKPTPVASKEGTTIMVSDLFYNVPHRRNMKERDEYKRIVTIAQRYALHYASKGVGFVCSRKAKGTETFDLNTTTLPIIQSLMKQRQNSTEMTVEDRHTATRRVFSQIAGAKLEEYLLLLECSSEKTASLDLNQCTYEALGHFINPSYVLTKGSSGLILFINDRLVDSTLLKRSIEGVYSGFTKSKPLVYLRIKVPGNHVDVNIHPTKRQVALLHEEEIFEKLASHIRVLLNESMGTFTPSSLLPSKITGKKRASLPSSSSEVASKKKLDPSNTIRTNKSALQGALEPYLVQTNRDSPSGSSGMLASMTKFDHKPGCDFHISSLDKLDLSKPGIFATAKCTCEVANDDALVRTQRQIIIRPRRVVPTACTYKSIQVMRERVASNADKELEKKIRDSVLVGVLSRRRCLVQCGAKLEVWNYADMAKELFFQLALANFSGTELGHFTGGGVDVKRVIEQALEVEKCINESGHVTAESQMNELNSTLAEQATNCLFNHADMLEEYFSIQLKRKSSEDAVILNALPVLLEGHSPQPYGLPLFLLRLATEVDWAEEYPCFEGICRELGSYYAQVPLSLTTAMAREENTCNANNGGTQQEALVTQSDKWFRHVLFPGISYLLVPQGEFAVNGTTTELALLSSLYKVFERCS